MAGEMAGGSVSFGFELEDNVTVTTDRMGAAQDKLASKAEITNAALDRQRLKNIETLASLNAFRSGIGALTSSMNTLGLVDAKTYESLQKVVAGMTMISAGAEAIKGAIGIMKALQAATKGYAIASVFATIAANPILGAAAVAGAGATAGIFLYAMNNAEQSSSSSSTTNNTTINVNSYQSSDQRMTSQGFETGSYYGA
jgi:hypothetical protein